MKKEWFKRVQTFIGTSKEVIILGPLELSEADLEELKKFRETPTFGLDGGLCHRTEQPHFLSIGDGDSAKTACDISFNTNKDYSDLEGLIKLLPPIVEKIICFGLSGGRTDHQLAVIGNFLKLSKNQNTQINICGKNRIDILPAGSRTQKINGMFTIMTSVDCVVSISGDCHYQGADIQFEAFSARGLSNIGTGIVKTVCNEPLALFYPAEKSGEDNIK